MNILSIRYAYEPQRDTESAAEFKRRIRHIRASAQVKLAARLGDDFRDGDVFTASVFPDKSGADAFRADVASERGDSSCLAPEASRPRAAAVVILDRPSREEFAVLLAAHYERIDKELRILKMPRIFHPEKGGGKERVKPVDEFWDPLRDVVPDEDLLPFAAAVDEPMALEVGAVVAALGLLDPWSLVQAQAHDMEGEWRKVMTEPVPPTE